MYGQSFEVFSPIVSALWTKHKQQIAELYSKAYGSVLFGNNQL